MSPFVTRRDDADLAELVQQVAALALDDAGIDMAAVDLVVVAQAPDPLHGLGHPEQTLAGALALGGQPMIRVHTGGATGGSAVNVAAWAVGSGRFDTVLVVGAEKMGDNVAGAQQVLNEIWDPAYEAAMPLNTIANASLMAVRYMERYGAGEEDFARIAVRLRANGARNTHAHLRSPVTADDVMASPYLTWPIRRGMSCPRSSGGCAVVVTSETGRRAGGTAAWILAAAARTHTYFMGDRMRGRDGPVDEYIAFNDLRQAADEAYRAAGITDPRRELDVAEPYVPFSTYEPMMLEALRFCSPGKAIAEDQDGTWAVDGPLPVCPSGGVLCSNPISVTALVRVAEAAQQVRGAAGDHQVHGARTALATGAGGDAQFSTVTILSAEEPARR